MNQNYDFRTLHEGFLKDIFDIVLDVKNGNESIFEKLKKSIPNVTNKNDEIRKINNRYGRNIAKASQGLTATFPMIVTEAVPIDQAVMIAKAVERKCCAMLQMLFAANQITNVGNAHAYIAKFHKNLSDNDLDFSDYSVDDMINATYDLQENTIFDSLEFQAMVNRCIEEVNEDCKYNTQYYLSEGIQNPPISSYRVKKVFNELDMSSFRTHTTDISTQNRDLATNPNDENLDPVPVVTTTRNSTTSGSKVTDLKAAYDALNKTVIPTDIQKANEAIPTMMIINFVSKGDGEHPITSQAVIGVKARLQYVSSKDMMDRIVSKNSDSNGLFKFIKATTGQISFWKDFVFALDKAKVDSIASSGKGSSSPVWKMLERRATLSRIKRWTGSVNDAAAISTIVISREEADAIKKNERMDLDRVNAVHSVMNGYNIMGFVIVDESLERASFLFDDGSSSYETISFTHLERQGNDGGAYKKVINLLTKNR